MTKKAKTTSVSKNLWPSFTKEAFNMVQPGKSNHVSANASKGRRSKHGR